MFWPLRGNAVKDSSAGKMQGQRGSPNSVCLGLDMIMYRRTQSHPLGQHPKPARPEGAVTSQPGAERLSGRAAPGGQKHQSHSPERAKQNCILGERVKRAGRQKVH